ncbi:uncharacterized protein MELLADRAFT_114538, partial [Melampsora larici-populina 98AG31]
CPTAKHYVRTFKLNQLRHEIACINAGATYPIPFDPSSHGPPVNIKGMPVAPRTSPPNKSKTSNSNRPNQTAPPVDCARPNVGPTAKSHKKTGHNGCTSLYCKSCCQQFTPPGGCYVHRPKGQPVQEQQVPPAAQIPAIATLQGTTSQVRIAPPAPLPAAKRSRILPPQCAQSVRRVGHLFDDEGVALLATARHYAAEQSRKESKPLIDQPKVTDHTKVITLNLITRVS